MSNDNVEWFGGKTSIDLPVDMLVEDAMKKITDKVIVMGYTEDDQFYFAHSCSVPSKVLLELEMAKRILIDNVMYGLEE